MQRYKADEWIAVPKGGTASFDISLKEFVDIMVSCTGSVAIRASGEKCGAVLQAGTGTYRFKGSLFGYKKIEVIGDGKTEFGMRANLKAAQIGEPLDHEKAPVIPVPTSSDKLIADLQTVIRTEMRQNKMSVLEPEFGASIYDYDHDEEGIFEEHEAAAAAKAEEAKKAKAQQQKNPPDVSKKPEGDKTPPVKEEPKPPPKEEPKPPQGGSDD